MSNTGSRDIRLDGLRGLATLAVVVSHFVAEVPSGLVAFAVGHIAVTVFFVLSGFLIGRLVLDRGDDANFFQVFYGRRFLRTVPSYAVVLMAILSAGALGGGLDTGTGTIPPWTYATFTQNIAMGWFGTIGNEWLAPTWALAVEEQFYLVAPLAIVVLPRRTLPTAVVAVIVAAIGYRWMQNAMGADYLRYMGSLLANADQIALGVGAAVLLDRRPLARFDRVLEVLPLLCLLAVAAGSLVLSREVLTTVPLRALLGLAAAAFILRLAVHPTCSSWLANRVLLSAGRHSYSIYLVHMGVAGLVHALVTGSSPDIGSPAAWLATALSFGATAGAAVALTTWIEDPCTSLGRRLRWSSARRGPAPAPGFLRS
ncbi:hypothetical protein ASG43_16895 [Aureimonas sp. Leaf454]|uniref:acyltransferase family protein n=1 Tax=Aureimonas sp. Leaf454 TaxID=1736381 RepID=UPI0006F791E4|nr:acyltransferase [Aureimonas sp. Leaf454]KQT43176.1 hypothetical protein ASG43_16895 [Aureimonas sp. Leaf454]